MDNPGEWPEFTFHPKFKVGTNGAYTHHCIPTGAGPVPANLEGKILGVALQGMDP
jgi:hypothetical protein